MIYYKIPLTDGFHYPAGCILICAYTYDGYEYCKFERVTEVGTNWVVITESEFNVRCPDFPEPATPPVQEVIATSATMSGGSIMLELPAQVDTGTLVKFVAPCDCSSLKLGIVIDSVAYSVVDATGQPVNGASGVWTGGAHVSVIIDNANKRAYFQGTTALKNILATSPLVLVEDRDYGAFVPLNLAKGQIYFVKVAK